MCLLTEKKASADKIYLAFKIAIDRGMALSKYAIIFFAYKIKNHPSLPRRKWVVLCLLLGFPTPHGRRKI